MKTCITCKAPKPLEQFFRRTASRDGHAPLCKLCSGAAAREHAKLNRERSLETHRVRSKRYVERNREKRRETMRLYRLRNREEIKAYNDRYDAEHPSMRLQIKHRYWARKFATPYGRITAVQLADKLSDYGGFCAYCQERPHQHWDHVHSLSAGGHHVLENLVPSCAHCNHTKWAHRWPYPDPPVMIPSVS